MTRPIAELDIVEVAADTSEGFVSGARGTVVAVHDGSCTVEFLDPDGYTIGLFEFRTANLERVDPRAFADIQVRED